MVQSAPPAAVLTHEEASRALGYLQELHTIAEGQHTPQHNTQGSVDTCNAACIVNPSTGGCALGDDYDMG